MIRLRILIAGCLALTPTVPAFAQFGIPRFPGSRNKNTRRQRSDDGSQAAPAGVPVPLDSPLFDAFRKLEQQTVYHQRMTFTSNDPQVAQMMAQMGFSPAETITAGDTKQVSMHFQMPALGKVEDFELRTVIRNGRLAKKWVSPGSDRILKEQDAQIAKQLAEQETRSASSIAKNAASGPLGWVSSAVSAAGAAASAAGAARLKKQAHEFFEWTCMDSSASANASQSRKEPPPLTDLRVVGDQTLDGVNVTGYEFYVSQGGKSQGPIQMYIAKDSGLPVRLGMSDARVGGGMQMDYFGFNQGGDFEIPACLAEGK